MIPTYERFTIFVIACLVVALCTPIANAQKRGKPKQPAPYTVVPFSPPGLVSTASQVNDLNDGGHAVGGVIAGHGVFDVDFRGFLLIPNNP